MNEQAAELCKKVIDDLTSQKIMLEDQLWKLNIEIKAWRARLKLSRKRNHLKKK